MPRTPDLQLLHQRDDLPPFQLLRRVVAEVAVEDHACPARHAFVRRPLAFVWVGVLGDLDVVDEAVPFLPVADVEDGVVDHLRRRGDVRAGVDGEEAAGGDVVAGARPGEVGVVEVLACERCHVCVKLVEMVESASGITRLIHYRCIWPQACTYMRNKVRYELQCH